MSVDVSRRAERTRAVSNNRVDSVPHGPVRTENIDGVWVSAASNMRTYLLLKQRAQAFRADPEVQAALAASMVKDLAIPTLAPGESYADLLADRSAFEDFDPEKAGAQGYGFAQLDQLAVEHVLGARG